MAQTLFLVGKKLLTKNLPIYTKFLFSTTKVFSKSLFGRYKTFRAKFEQEHIDKIINLKRRLRKLKIQFKAKSKESEIIKKFRSLEIKGFLIKRSIKFKSGLNNLNLIKEKINPGLSLNSLKTFNTNNILPKLNELNQNIKKGHSLLAEYVKTAYQLIDKTIHSPKFNKFLILVFFLFGAVIVEDQLDKIKITQKVPGDEKAVNINATADTDLVFEYDYELTTKTKILKYIIHPAFASDENQPQLVLTDHDGKKHNPEFIVDREGEKSFSVRIAQNKIPPGAYEALLEVYKDGVYYQQEKEFTYGVLSVNTNKATFTPGEEITLNMGALKYDGHTICDADLELKITSPSGKESNPEVTQSGFCERDNVTNVPDYLATHKADEVGKHKMTLVNKDNGYQIEDFYEVQAEVPYSIERKGPSRIYPFVAYPMEITVIANQNFIGKITERVPKGFLIKGFETTSEEAWQTITWDVNLKKGENATYSYFFDAPDISPFLYLTGPLSIGDYQEVRMWQIASDADGSGTNVVVPTGVLMGSTDQTFTFTYDPSEILNSGELAIKVPTSRGWSTPQGSAGTAGYTTVSGSGNTNIGDVLVSGDSTSQGVWTLTEDDSDMCNTTASPFVDTTTKKEGAGAIQCDNSSSALPDDTDTFSFDATAQNWSSYTQISFWLRSTKALTSAAGIDFGYDNNAIFGSPVAIFDTGTVSANTWTYFVFDMTGTRTAITAFGLICDTTGCDNNTFWLDEVMVGPGSPTFVANGPDVDIRARFLDLASTDTVTVTYGAGGRTSGADVPSTSGIDEFTTRTRFDAGGTLTNISSHPTVNVASPAIDISGTCKQDDQTTNCTDTGTIKVAINGSIQAQVQNTVAGTWTISGLTSPNNGDVITVFIDGAGEADEAVAVTTYDGSGNVAGVELIEQRLSIGNSDNRTITNANLSQYDNSISADEDIFYDVDASNDLTLNDTSKSSAEIYIKSGNTYRPDSVSSGNVTTKALRITGTFTADGNTITLTGGNTALLTTGGTLNENTSTFKYTSSSYTTVTAETYYHLNLQPSSAGGPTYVLNSGTLSTRNLTIGDGTNPVTIDWTSQDPTINVGGNFTLNNNSTWTKSDTATMTFNGAVTPVTLTDNNSTKQDLGKVVIDGPKEVDLGSSVTVQSMNVTSGDTLDLQSSGYTLKVTGSGTGASRPFILSGTLTTGSDSTVEYTGSSATEVQAAGYNKLSVNQTGTTFTSSGNLTITNVFTINEGTFDAGGNIINLNGSGSPFVINGTFTSNTSTVKYSGTSATTVLAIQYYNLVVGEISLSSPVTYTSQAGTMDVLGYFSLGYFSGSTATFDANTNDTTINVTGNFNFGEFTANFLASSNSAAPLTVSGSFSNYEGHFSHNNGKVILNSAENTFQSIMGSNTFYNLEITGGDRVISFQQNYTNAIDANGSLNLTGTDCNNMLRVRSGLKGFSATLDINISATVTASLLDLQDINLTTKSITAGNSVNSGNNSANWTISPNGCIGTSTNQDTTGSSFQRKVIYDDQNSRYWSFNHDGDEIEVKYSSDEGSTWTNPATTASGRLPYDTNDFSVWWISMSTVEYVVVAVADGGSIKLRQGTLSGTDVTWDTDVSLAMDETGTYSRPYVSFDSANHIWVGATYYDGSDYVYKTVVSAEAASTDPSTWTWTTTPYQLSNAQTSLNVYGTLTALSSEDMYATFVVDTGLLGCRWDDSDTMWEDGTGASCLPTLGGGGEAEYFNSLQDGLVAHWEMNEASWNGTTGEVVDSTLSNYDGTSSGGATTAGSGFGRSGSFAGDNDYINAGDITELNSASAFSVSQWVNVTNILSSDRIFHKAIDGNNDISIAPYYQSGPRIYFEVGNGSNSYGYFALSGEVSNSEWANITVVFDGSGSTNEDRAKLYINGVQKTMTYTGTIPATTANLSANNLYLGSGNSTEYFTGNLDDVRIYNRALTSEEVAKLYQYAPESVNIDDASDFGALGEGNAQTVRTNSGILYSFINDSGSCEMWKSTDGVLWSIAGSAKSCSINSETAIAINASTTIHVLWNDNGLNQGLKHDTFSTVTDSFAGLDTIISTNVGGIVHNALNIAVNGVGEPHVVYELEDGSESTLRYDNKVDGTWNSSANISIVTSGGTTQMSYTNILINESNLPEIIFYDLSVNTIIGVAANSPDPTAWSYFNIDTSGFEPSAAVDTLTGYTWVAYRDSGNTLSLAKFSGTDYSGWSTGGNWSYITSNTNVVSEPKVVPIGGTIYVFYENDQDDIAYDIFDGTNWAGETVLHEGTFQDVKVKSSFEWNNYGPNKIDYIYSDGTDVYYDSLYLRRTPTNINDSSNFSEMMQAGQHIVRSSNGTLYTVLYVSGNCQIWKSADNGGFWTQVDPADTPSCDGNTNLSIAIDASDKIYFTASDFVLQQRLYLVEVVNDQISNTLPIVFSSGATLNEIFNANVALDSNQVPHISFGHYVDSLTQNYLKYSNFIGGGWNPTPVTIYTGDYFNFNMIMNDEDLVEFAYINTSGELIIKRADQNDASSFTDSYTIDSSVKYDYQNIGMAVDVDGNTWIAYTDEDGTSDYLNLVKHNDSDGWTTWQSVIETTYIAIEPSISIIGSDVYVFYEDDQDDIVYDKYDSVAQTWSGETVLEMHGALQDVKPRWSYINNYDSTGVAPVQTNTYYFDGSDVAASDPNGVWTNETNADDSDFSTVATSTTKSEDNGLTNHISIEGTNVSGLGSIMSVKFRFHGKSGYTNDFSSALDLLVDIYTDGGTSSGQFLGRITKRDANSGWTDYLTLTAPSGGWSEEKISSLEAVIYNDAIPGGFDLIPELGMVEILVESTNTTSQSEIDYLYSDGTDVFYNRLSLGVSSVPGVQDSIVTGLSTGLHKNISTVGQTISTIDYVHLAYVNSSGNIYYDRYDGDWDFTNASLDANTDNTYLGLSKDTATNDVYLGYIGSTSDDIFTKKATYSAGPNWSWGTSSTLVTDATEIFTNYNANNTGNGKVGAIYSIGDLSPYNIGWETVLSGTTNNAPTVSNIVVNGGSNISLTSGSTHNVSWTATITDLDGNAEIAGVTGKLYKSGVAGAESCTPNNNNCYADAVCDLTSCSGNICTATCTVAMYFHADATDANSTMPSEYWRGWMEATDSHSDTGSEFSATNAPDVESLSALDIVTSIDYGLMLAGDSSSEKTTLVTNEGNIILDLELLGDSMCTDYPTCAGDSIAVGQQEYSMSTFTYGSGTDLTSSAFRIQFNLAKPTSSPSSQTKNLYWRLGLDPGQDVGVYDGMNTVLAKNDNIP